MSKFAKIISLCALVALIVYACMESEMEMEMEMDPVVDESTEIVETPQRTERHRPLRIRDARAWLEETQPPVVLRGQQREARTRLAESGGRTVLDDREPVNIKLWRHAKRSQNEQFSVVEIPVYSTLQRFIVRANSQPLELREQPGISRLVIRRDMFTGHVDAFVQTFTGDSMYIAQPNFRRNLFQNRYLTRDENFSGSEVISSLEGEFLKGFFVENGRRVRRFGEPVPVVGRDSEQYQSTRSIQSFGRGGFVCDYEEIRYYEWVESSDYVLCDFMEEWSITIIREREWFYKWVPIYCDDEECPNCSWIHCICCPICGEHPCGCPEDEPEPEPEPVQLFSVTVSTNPTTGGTASVLGTNTNIPSGLNRIITASPNPNYEFVNWTGSQTSASRQFTFSVNSDMSFIANFVRLFTVTVNANPGGTASGGGRIRSGAQTTISASPNPGFEFVGWTGSASISLPSMSLTVNRDLDFTANFVNVRPEDYCEQVALLEAHAAFRYAMFRLNERTGNNREYAAFFEPNGTFPLENLSFIYNQTLFPGPDDQHVIYLPLPSRNIGGMAHTHFGDESLSIFSPADLWAMHQLLMLDKMDDPNTFFSALVTAHGTTYVLMIEDINRFRQFGQNSFGGMQNQDPETADALLAWTFHNMFHIRPGNSASDNERGFINFLSTANTGLVLFRGNTANFNNWDRLHRLNNGNIGVNPCP